MTQTDSAPWPGYLLTTTNGIDTITCLACGRTSANKGDIENRYCGKCHVFHDDQAAADAMGPLTTIVRVPIAHDE
jgi:hypothetical protein